MSPAKEPYAQSFETLNLIKQTDLSDEKLFYKDKEGNIFPYLKTEICSKIDVFKPYTFFPIFQELDIPFLEGQWLYRVENSIEQGVPEKKLAAATFGKYLGWCKLYDIKKNTFKDSDKFFSNWYDYQNFHYIYDPPYWKISYRNENLKDWQKNLTKYFSKQEGRPHPINNHVAVCGFVSLYLNDWKNFVKKLNREESWRTGQFEVVLSNNERWVFINPNNNYIRGYRFDKILANKNINKEIINEVILPSCVGYCKSFEWF